jgi:hypothetical protein
MLPKDFTLDLGDPPPGRSALDRKRAGTPEPPRPKKQGARPDLPLAPLAVTPGPFRDEIPKDPTQRQAVLDRKYGIKPEVATGASKRADRIREAAVRMSKRHPRETE